MPSNTAEIITAVGGIVTTITGAIVIVLQLRNNKKQNVIHGQINGMQEKLITAEKSASKEQGKEEGRQEEKNKQ